MPLQLNLNITQLRDHGQSLYQQEDYEGALRLYYQAWVKLNKTDGHSIPAKEILTDIGSTYFRLGRYEPAIEALRSALDQSGNQVDTLTLLRLGQCLLDSEQHAQARTYLQRAYRIGGASIFAQEDDKYISAITDLVA